MLTELIRGLTSLGARVHFAPSGDGVQAFVRRPHEDFDHSAVGEGENAEEEALLKTIASMNAWDEIPEDERKERRAASNGSRDQT